MRNSERWLTTEFEFCNGELRYARNVQYGRIESRLVVGSIAKLYEKHLPVYVENNMLDLGCGNGFYRSISPDPTCVHWSSSQHGNIHLNDEADHRRCLNSATIQ